MASELMVARRTTRENVWQVYEVNGPIAGSVSSWRELQDMVAARGLQSHQVRGDGVAEMTTAFGPAPR
ncbi:MAG: hypothetical protein ACRDNZ_23235 [Streptosporangiaceae bacterium]